MAKLRTAALACGSSLFLSMSMIASVAAQDFPTRIIKVIVPFPAGGVLDSITRAVTERLKDKLGQSVMIENRGGAAGTIGLEACMKSPPDGYTLCSATVEQMSTRPHLEPEHFARYKDLAPVTQMVGSRGVLFVGPNVDATSLDGLVRLAKERPGKLNYASFGWGSAPHLVYEWLNAEKGIDIYHVPQKSAGDMMTELLGGRIEAAYVTVGFAKPNVDAGKIKPLAVLGKARSALLPNVPSLGELGLDFPYDGGWFALLGPPGIDKPVLAKIVAGVRAVLADPELKAKFLDPQGYVRIGNTPEEFGDVIKTEQERFRRIVAIANAKPRK